MDQYIGRLLDNRYEILEIIGTGGMAVVYKARCHRLNRLVAIKILKDEFARDEEFRRRFHAEGEAVGMLSHPNIVQVYDVSSSDTANYIVMELIDGISMKQYMEKKGVLNWKETLHFSMQIAKALEHAHSRGIIHRDIKPHNVMVLKNGSVKVTDFGIARVMSKSNTLTKEALGSVHYISPEQTKGGWVDNRSDIYSLSVVMYEMMTGRPPYDGESPVAVAIQHINGGAAMPSTLNPNIPGGLEQIIMKGMALDLKNRYASATDMLQDMEQFRRDPGVLFIMPTTKVSDETQAIDLSNLARQSRGGAAMADGGMRATGKKVVSASDHSNRNLSGKRETKRPRKPKPEDEKRSRITTIAIVSCCAVAVIAIVILLFTILNGGLGRQDLVKVPNLEGMYYDQVPLYEDFVIKKGVPKYDDNIPAGQIIEQKPSGDSYVVRGTEIRVTVSLGKEPMERTMEDLLGYDVNEARTYLIDQGYYVLVDDQPSDEYEIDEVIATDPIADTKLTEGQTIRLTISSGPRTGIVPNLVGKDYETAMETLSDLGFHNVDWETIASASPKGQIVRQSLNWGTEVRLDSAIVLYISEGPQETDPPEESTEPPETTEPSDPTEPEENPNDPTEPSEDPVVPETVTKQQVIGIPNRQETYALSIYHNGVAILESITINPGQTSVTISLTGSGTQNYDIYVNGAYHNTITVEFKIDG